MTYPAELWHLLTAWLPPNDDPDRPQVTLSTVAADGGADARTVLMTEFNEHGFYFHTDARSRKVADIAGNPGVAITVLWPNFTRQLVIRGLAEVAAAEEAAAAYAGRSAYLKQLAWQNSLEFAQLPIEHRHAEWASFTEEHGASFDQPPTWVGFLVRPTRLTFWEGSSDAASRRTEYALDRDCWTVGYLAG